APGHTQQLDHGRLRGPRRQPGGGVVEGAGVAGAVTRPGDRRDHDAVVWTVHPRRLCLEEGADRPQIERPPAPPSSPLVVAGATPTAHPAPSSFPPPKADGDDDRGEVFLAVDILLDRDPLHDHPLYAEQARPYPCPSHAVRLPAVPVLKKPETVGAV